MKYVNVAANKPTCYDTHTRKCTSAKYFSRAFLETGRIMFAPVSGSLSHSTIKQISRSFSQPPKKGLSVLVNRKPKRDHSLAPRHSWKWEMAVFSSRFFLPRSTRLLLMENANFNLPCLSLCRHHFFSVLWKLSPEKQRRRGHLEWCATPRAVTTYTGLSKKDLQPEKKCHWKLITECDAKVLRISRILFRPTANISAGHSRNLQCFYTTLYRDGIGSDWKVAFSRLLPSAQYRQGGGRRENATFQWLGFPPRYSSATVSWEYRGEKIIKGKKGGSEKYGKEGREGPRRRHLLYIRLQYPRLSLQLVLRYVDRLDSSEFWQARN